VIIRGYFTSTIAASLHCDRFPLHLGLFFVFSGFHAFVIVAFSAASHYKGLEVDESPFCRTLVACEMEIHGPDHPHLF
jgi:hypothetical protein